MRDTCRLPRRIHGENASRAIVSISASPIRDCRNSACQRPASPVLARRIAPRLSPAPRRAAPDRRRRQTIRTLGRVRPRFSRAADAVHEHTGRPCVAVATAEQSIRGGFDPPIPPNAYSTTGAGDDQVYFGYKDGIGQQSYGATRSAANRMEAKSSSILALHVRHGTRAYYRTVLPRSRPNSACTAARSLPHPAPGRRWIRWADRIPGPDFGAKFGITDRKCSVSVEGQDVRPLRMARHRAFPIDGNNLPPSLPPQKINDFDYQADTKALICPIGAHIRRGNPRDTGHRPADRAARQPVVERRILRRNLPYQLPYDAENRNTGERGLVAGSSAPV